MKKLPLALVVGLILEAAFGLVRLGHFELMDGFDKASYIRWGVFESSFAFANAALISVGLFQVAAGLRGNQALGARVAGWAMAFEVAIGVGWGLIGVYSFSRGSVEHYVAALNWLHSIAYLAASIGILVATQKLGRGITAAVIVAALIPIPPLRDAMHDLGFGKTLGFILTFSPYILVSLLWLAMFVSTDEVELPPASVPADAAYNSAARSIWIRVIAACSLAGITFIMALSGEQSLMTMFRGLSILSPLVDALALGLLARAALQLVRAKIAPGTTMAAAVCSLLATGAVLSHVPTLYRLLFGEQRYGASDDLTSSTLVYALALAVFSIAALTLIAMSVAKLARERNAEDVRENVSIRIGVFVVLSLGSLFVSTYGASHLPNSRGVILFVLLALVFAAFYSLVLIAKICATGAELVARDPVGLPTAKVVQ